jgi:hypothetical protein
MNIDIGHLAFPEAFGVESDFKTINEMMSRIIYEIHIFWLNRYDERTGNYDKQSWPPEKKIEVFILIFYS